MAGYQGMVNESAHFLSQKMDKMPVVGILTGTGLSESVAALHCKTTINYQEIPHFPLPTVSTHAGRLNYGLLSGKAAVVFQGRFHLYEGYGPLEVTFPIRIMQSLGVKVLILTNASGGLNLSYSAGDIMLLSDHINLTGENCLVGPNCDAWGLRFPDMTSVYSPELTAAAEMHALKTDISIRKGVYVGLKGPSLETPAEMRYLRTIGADAVGFSTVMEAIAGVHARMRILGISTITNINNPDHPATATMEGIVAVAQKAAGSINSIIEAVVSQL